MVECGEKSDNVDGNTSLLSIFFVESSRMHDEWCMNVVFAQQKLN